MGKEIVDDGHREPATRRNSLRDAAATPLASVPCSPRFRLATKVQMKCWAVEIARALVDELLRFSSASSFAFLKAAPLCGLCIGAARVAPSCRRRKVAEARCELVFGAASLCVGGFAVSRVGLLGASEDGEVVSAEVA